MQSSSDLQLPDDERSIRVNLNISDIISMSLPRLNFFHRVVIIHSKMHIVRTGNNPLFPHDKFSTSYRNLAHLE